MCFQRVPMSLDYFSHQCDSLRCRNVREANQSCMRSIIDMNQLSEIGIDRN